MLCNCHAWEASVACQNSFFKIAIKINSTCPPENILPTSVAFYGLGRQEPWLVGGGVVDGWRPRLKMT